MKPSRPSATEGVLKARVLLFVGTFIVLLASGGVLTTLLQPSEMERYWLVATPLISNALAGMLWWHKTR